MTVPPLQEQDKGLAHCHYIRQLANEIWMKENERPGGINVKFEECISRALMLHCRKLINNRVAKLVPAAPVNNPRITKIIPPARQIGW